MKPIIVILICLVSITAQAQSIFGHNLALDSLPLCGQGKCDTLLLGLTSPDLVAELYDGTSSSEEIGRYAGNHEQGSYYKEVELRDDSIGVAFRFKSNRCKSRREVDTALTYLYQVSLFSPGKLRLSNGVSIGSKETQIQNILGAQGVPVVTESEKKIILHSDLGLECRYSLVGNAFQLAQITIDQTARTRILNNRKK